MNDSYWCAYTSIRKTGIAWIIRNVPGCVGTLERDLYIIDKSKTVPEDISTHYN